MSDDLPPEEFDYGERQEDGQFENYPTIDEGEFEQKIRKTYVHGKCGTKTTMTRDLAESVARDPTYYAKTFCTGCREHVPVSEVQWEDGKDWIVGNSTHRPRDDFGGTAVLHLEIDGEPVNFGNPDSPARGNIGVHPTSKTVEFEVNGQTVTIDVVAFVDDTGDAV